MGRSGRTRGPVRWAMVAAVIGLLWCIAARVAGPSDAYDQTQPKTMAYTTDILVNGNWLLPVEQGRHPATKPPLYNWLAAPAVAALGFSSDLAHKLPSVLALLACWTLLVIIGRTIDGGGPLGWLAGLCFVANYSVFKLGYLARPDMLLTLWLLIGWMAATIAVISPRTRPSLVIAFWGAVILALLTKGPPVAVLLIYALLAGKVLLGRWAATARLQWLIGLPVAMTCFAGWFLAVRRIDPEHARFLWEVEVLGRVVGMESTGEGRTPLKLLMGLAHMPVYYVIRFMPWSILSIAALIQMRRSLRPRSEHARFWLRGCGLFLFTLLAVFTVSAGKRADYAVAAFGTGSLLAAWWLCRGAWMPALSTPWVAPLAAAIVLGVLTTANMLQVNAPVRGFGPAIAAFIEGVEDDLRAEPRPVEFWAIATNHLQSHLGYSRDPSATAILRRMRAGESFWVIAGIQNGDPPTLPLKIAQIEDRHGLHGTYEVRVVRSSAELPRRNGWPAQVTLFAMDPIDPDDRGTHAGRANSTETAAASDNP